MNTKRRWLGIICLLAALVAIAWWLSGPSTAVRLSDGTTLRLLGVTTGTNWFSTERPWHRLARRALPVRYQHLIPPMRAAQWGYLNGATYWFELRDRTNGVVRPQWERAETVSDVGDVLQSSASPQLSSPHIFGIAMDCFPRRERTFRYRIYDGKKILLGEIRLPNPFAGPFPDWKPDPLPATRTNGELTATLVNVRKFMEEIPAGKTNVSFKTDIEFRWQGERTTDWETGPCFVEDATGNSVGWLHPGLPQSEKVWRWRVWIQRRSNLPGPPEEIFVITNLPVPGAGSWTLLNVTTNLQGLDFWIGGWVGASALTLSNGYPFQVAMPPTTNDWQELAWGPSSGAFVKTNVIQRPTLVAAIFDRGIPLRARIGFRDQSGRLLPMDESGQFRSIGHMPLRSGIVEGHFYRPLLDETVRSVSIEVTVHPRREMTFFIAPPAEGEWIGRRPTEARK